MKVLIVSGGSIPKCEIIKFYSKKANLIIGVDSGCKYLLKNSIVPHYIVGDFDSANKDDIIELENKGVIKYQYNSEKDFTDSEIAMNLAIDNNATEIIFLGGTGSRFDHTFANIGLMLKAKERGVNLVIIDDNNKIYMVNKDTEFKRDKNYDYISFLAYRDPVENLEIKGAKYSLKNYTLKVGESRTVSNEFLEEKINISFDSGIILAIYSKD